MHSEDYAPLGQWTITGSDDQLHQHPLFGSRVPQSPVTLDGGAPGAIGPSSTGTIPASSPFATSGPLFDITSAVQSQYNSLALDDAERHLMLPTYSSSKISSTSPQHPPSYTQFWGDRSLVGTTRGVGAPKSTPPKERRGITLGSVNADGVTPLKMQGTKSAVSDISPVVSHVVQSALDTPARPSPHKPGLFRQSVGSAMHQPTVGTTIVPPFAPDSSTGGSIVVVEFKLQRMLRFKCQGVQVMPGECVIVRLTSGVLDCGLSTGVFARSDAHLIPSHIPSADAGVVLRVADEADYATIEGMLPQIEERAIALCHQLIHFLHIPFDVIDTECTFDRSVITFMYTVSDPQAHAAILAKTSRLQRELAISLKAEIVLRQVELVPCA